MKSVMVQQDVIYCLSAQIEIIEIHFEESVTTYLLLDHVRDKFVEIEAWNQGDCCWVYTQNNNQVLGEKAKHRRFYDGIPKKWASMGIG